MSSREKEEGSQNFAILFGTKIFPCTEACCTATWVFDCIAILNVIAGLNASRCAIPPTGSFRTACNVRDQDCALLPRISWRIVVA